MHTPEWQEKFKSQMTRVSFELKLTRAMLEFLCAASDDVYWDRAAFGGLHYPDNWLATEYALTKRGLIVRRPPIEVKGRTVGSPPWELTPAGHAAIELLKVGGLFIEAQKAADRFAARKGKK